MGSSGAKRDLVNTTTNGAAGLVLQRGQHLLPMCPASQAVPPLTALSSAAASLPSPARSLREKEVVEQLLRCAVGGYQCAVQQGPAVRAANVTQRGDCAWDGAQALPSSTVSVEGAPCMYASAVTAFCPVLWREKCPQMPD